MEAILHRESGEVGMGAVRGQNRLLGPPVPRTGHWTAARSWRQACRMGTGAAGKTMDAVWRQRGGCLGKCWSPSRAEGQSRWWEGESRTAPRNFRRERRRV